MDKIRRFLHSPGGLILLIAAAVLLYASVALAYDGSINQGVNHASEESMYCYTFMLSLDNPCNSDDMDKDAVNELWFDIEYVGSNGYGIKSTYRFDMSWKDGRNQNEDILKKCFIRPNDTACLTQFDLWVPGLIQNVKVHLNMDGGERLGFTLTGIFLNGFRVNTGTDYVSSCYYDSNASIPCYIPAAALKEFPLEGGNAGLDQYGGIFTEENEREAAKCAASEDDKMFYRYAE